jgi:hypothetical protein
VQVFVQAVRQAATEGKTSLPREASTVPDETALELRAQPRQTRIAAEAKLSRAALSDLPEAALQLTQVAPEMAFEFVGAAGGVRRLGDDSVAVQCDAVCAYETNCCQLLCQTSKTR